MSNSTKRSFCYEQPFSIGGHTKRCILNMAGPTAYDSTNKDIVSATMFGGGPNTKVLEAHVGGLADSGTYFTRLRYGGEGPTTSFKLIWYVVATGAEVANGVDLSAERYRLRADFIQ